MQENHTSGGMLAVGLMALHDKKFFAELLEGAAAAIAKKKEQGLLREVTAEDVARVEAAIAERMARGGPDPMEMWDHYDAIGEWHPKDWVFEWAIREWEIPWKGTPPGGPDVPGRPTDPRT